jgi:hypothetical protein
MQEVSARRRCETFAHTAERQANGAHLQVLSLFIATFGAIIIFVVVAIIIPPNILHDKDLVVAHRSEKSWQRARAAAPACRGRSLCTSCLLFSAPSSFSSLGSSSSLPPPLSFSRSRRTRYESPEPRLFLSPRCNGFSTILCNWLDSLIFSQSAFFKVLGFFFFGAKKSRKSRKSSKTQF